MSVNLDMDMEQGFMTWLDSQEGFEEPCQRGEFCVSHGGPATHLVILAGHGSCGVLRRLFCADDAHEALRLGTMYHVVCKTEGIPVLSITPL